jgi:hypothetical protein
VCSSKSVAVEGDIIPDNIKPARRASAVAPTVEQRYLLFCHT